jgi:PAS domain S-box-containing protein
MIQGKSDIHGLNREAKACTERALDARREADRTANAALRAGFLRMEKGWELLARSHEEVESAADRSEANSDWQQEFDERVPTGRRPDDEPQLQKLIHDRNVDVLFERMWLASIVESSDDAIVSKNVNGIIMSWNKSAERLFGYAAEEVIGKPVTIIIPPERQYEEDLILAHIRRGKRVDHYQTVRQHKDGSLVDISLTVSPIRGAEGRVVGASKIARDITAQKRAGELLRRQADLLDQSHDAILIPLP